jgi:hypothetical protein
LNLKPAASPARSIMRAKPPVVNGAPRSDVKTKGDFGSCSRCRRRRARISSPRIGCVAGVPLLALRTNIHWAWTPNGYLPAGIGVLLAWIVTVAIVSVRDRMGR